MEENNLKVNPEDIHLGDIGRVILNMPRAAFNNWKKKRAKFLADKEEAKRKKQELKERRKAKRKSKNIFKKFAASILNHNPREVEKIREREDFTEEDFDEEYEQTLHEQPEAKTSQPAPEPTTNGQQNNEPTYQNIAIEDMLGQKVQNAGIRVIRINKDLYVLVLQEKDETRIFEAKKSNVSKLQ